MSRSFTWTPLYEEIARLLVDWEGRQDELIAALESLRASGVVVTPFEDMDAAGRRFTFTEIDPFTFFGTFNRRIKKQERIAILGAVKTLLGATNPLPSDFDGVPILNNQRSWFVRYHADRGRDDVAKLWRVFRLALQRDPLADPAFAAAFDAALDLWGVSTNLTMGLFWIRPSTFLNLDTTNRAFLDIDLPADGLSSRFYIDTVREVASKGTSFPELSVDAYHAAQETTSPKPKPKQSLRRPEVDYWLVGAYWSDNDAPDMTPQFLAEGIWQNGYKDKYLDKVRAMKVGDRIGIKSASTQKRDLPFDARGRTVSRMTIKAIGTIVANRGDGRTVEVEWDPHFEEKDWFFFTSQRTVWKLRTEEDYRLREYAEKLIAFVWEGAPQDYQWFCDRWFAATSPEQVVPEDDEVGRTAEPYGIDDLLDSGVFQPASDIREAIDRFRIKKNVIFQGPPGVGKTYVARKIAYALMKEKAKDRVEAVQFHQSYSYEDFIRGYRPLAEDGGRFGLQDGVFLTFCRKAADDPDNDYVFIIDEINRGNLSQIFGELLMLIEADKRGPENAVPLVYQRPGECRFFVPHNVHLIGLMNTADRSLSLVDYALRRRFAFVTLTPQFASKAFQSWLTDRGMNSDLVKLIASRLIAANTQIREDPLLGENYQIGHSFFCPTGDDFSILDRAWYLSIIRTEIVPLLREYWYDNPQKASDIESGLLVP
jgi:5-methylcytosine-specific restriction protein B